MAVYLRPGVYVQEVLNPLPSVLGPSSNSVAAFAGYTAQGPTTPTLVNSWSQYLSYYGGWTANNNLHLAVLLFFSNGGSSAYILRTVATTAATASRTFNDRNASPASTLKISAQNPGTWGNNLIVNISDSVNQAGYVDIAIYQGGTTQANLVESFLDLSMVTTDNRYAPSVINGQSAYVTVTDLGSNAVGALRDPVNSTLVSLSGGLDYTSSAPASTDIANSLSGFDTVKNSLVLNLPGVTDATAVNLALNYASNRNDVFVVIDGINDTPANQITRANSYTATSFGAVYYPPLTIKDPTTNVVGATLTVGAGGAVTGLFMATDASRGVFKAPAGLQTRVAGAISIASISNNDLDSLNTAANPVNAIRYITGSGIVVMGSRTLSQAFISKYVPIRRTLIYLEKALTDLTQFAVFEPNDPKLWRRLTATCEGFLNDFWRKGGLRGATPAQAYFVKCDADLNPQSQIDAGYVNVEIGVSLQRPAEFVVIKIGQFDGGATVTVS
jgi:phage tail sheath protein FI